MLLRPGDAQSVGTAERRLLRRERLIDRRLRVIARLMYLLTVPFVRYEIRGGARTHGADNIIIAANHRSVFDVAPGLITAVRFGRHPRILIARQFVEGRWTGPIARWIGAIPVSPGRQAGDALDDGITALRDGFPTIVMPEGRLHRDADDRCSTGTARTGISRLAVGSAVPVVVAALLGTDRVWPPGRRPRCNPFRRKTVVVQVADEPLHLDGADHRANTDQVMAAVRRELERAAADHPELAT